MEYTKESNFFRRISSAIARHKVMTTVVSITIILMVLDFMLISGFLHILSSM